MGKKNKKLNKTPDLQVLVANEGTDEQDGTNLTKSLGKRENILNNSEITDNNSADRMNTKKKKRKHASADVVNDTSVQSGIIDERTQSVDDELDESKTLEGKEKKKKKRHITHEDELPIEKTGIENVNNQIMDNESKKKKKKSKGNSLIEAESKDNIGQINEESVENDTKISKKKIKKSNQLYHAEEQMTDEPVENETKFFKKKTNENVSNEEKPKVTKSQKKKKTGTAVLNAEESQVTEEDIDKFCDGLDEEDNKQYEDWVKLIEASLPPPRVKT